MEGVIATPHGLATRAGSRAYAAGGNAIDAALAAAAMLAVVYPHQCSAGGDLFALVDSGEGATRCVNGSGAAPFAVTADALRNRYAEIPDAGVDSITVPGVIAGWQRVHELGARLPLAELLAPAIEAAAEGVSVSGSLARGIQFRHAVLMRDPGMREVFLPGGTPLTKDQRLVQPRLSRTLERLVREGLQSFYDGAVGHDLVDGLTRLGCPLAAEDLAAHRTETCPPLQLVHRDVELQTSPPNSQGFVLLTAIAALHAIDVPIDPLGQDARHLLRALLLGAEDRDRYLGDPRRAALPWPELAAPATLRHRMAPDMGAECLQSIALRAAPSHGDTVAVCALDSSGAAVSLIQSVFQTFGSGILEPGTGVILHNRARGFTLRRGAPNEFAPGCRPAHTLMPLLVRRGSRTIAALGTMGGRAQPQVLAQVLPGALDGEVSVADALSAPRWVFGAQDIGFESATVAIEADAPTHLDESLRTAQARTARIPAHDERVGHAQLVRRRTDGALEGASDPRSDGSAERVRETA